MSSVDIAAIYEELLAIKVDLDFDEDPRPSTLQEKILECNSAMRKVEKRMIEVTREYASRDKSLKIEQSRVDIKKRGILLNDSDIKKLPTGKERESAADELLESDHKKILDLSNDVAALQNLQSSIKLVQQNMRTTNSDIRMLIRIMEQQISRLNIGTKDDKEVRDLMDGLSEVEDLEGEMTLDDVESSIEGEEAVQPDGSTDEGTTNQTDTPSDGEGSGTDDELDSLDSFITEDAPESNEGLEALDDGDDDEGDGSAQSAVTEEVEPEDALDADVTEVASDDGGGSGEGGLDIDLGDILGDDSLKEASDSEAVSEVVDQEFDSTSDVGDILEDKTSVDLSDEGGTPETVESKDPPKTATGGDDFDVEDLLSSLDV